jgi:hypothetical protein
LAGELTAVYRGSGGAEADIQRYIQQLSPQCFARAEGGRDPQHRRDCSSPASMRLNDQYRQGMGTTAQQLQLLDPQAQLIVQHLGGFDAAGSPQDGAGGPTARAAVAPPPNMPNDPMAPATGQTKEVVDPNLTPVRREYMARLQAGQSPAQLIQFLTGAGVKDPALLRTAVQQAQWRQKNPKIPVSQYDTSAIDHITQQMGVVNRALNAAGQSDIGAGIVGAGDAITGGYMPDIIGATGGNEDQARLSMKYLGQDHPGATLTGNIAGGTIAGLAGEGALGAAGMEAGVGRSMLADSGYGAAYGSGVSPDNRAEGAVFGGVVGGLGSLAGQGLTRGLGAAARGVR